MVVTTIGLPFQGLAWYWVEGTYGGGSTSATTLPISAYIQNISIGTGDKIVPIRGIDSAVVKTLIEQTNEPVISIEYNPQLGDTFIDDVVDRSSCCTLQSLAFEFGANTCTGLALTDDVTYYLCKGFKPSTVRIAGAKNEPYTVTVDLEGKSIVTSTTASIVTAPSALTGAILQFNVAGSIAKVGGWIPTGTKIAYITNSIDITFNHQLTSYTDHDTLDKAYIVDGTMDVEGTVDITLDGAGGMHFGEVKLLTNFTITVNMGAVGAVKISLVGCKWKSATVPINVDGEAMMNSSTFISVPSACSNMISVVT